MVIFCKLCSYRCSIRISLIKHSFEAHSMEPLFNFVCGIQGCLHCFKNGSSFSSFKSHASRKHPNWQEYINAELPLPSLSLSSSDELNCEDHIVEDSLQLSLVENTSEHENTVSSTNSQLHNFPQSCSEGQKRAALFLLTFKEKYNLSQTAIDFAVGSVQQMLNSVCTSAVTTVDVDPLVAETIAANLEDPFSLLQTSHQQTKFYRENFGLVEPVTVELGMKFKYVKSGAKRRLVEKPDTFQYVPLLDNLQWLLHNRDISDQIFCDRTTISNECLKDYCDGQLYKDHPLFGNDKNSLQLIMYFDEVEVANPLGSYKGHHKLGLFYYIIGNIEPKLRSSLRNIQLIACVKAPLIQEYGFEKVLEPFIEDANKLSNGVLMKVNGENKLVKGGVLFALADTLAAHQLGGFKVGVGFALRKCRMCLATKEQLSVKFKASQFIPRTPETYDYHCSLLEGLLAIEDSVTYGVLYNSPLNKLNNFHVVYQMPQDIMHVLLEGVIPYELGLMLTCFVYEKKYITSSKLNNRITCFEFTSNEAGDKPSPISFTSNKLKLSQTAAQMWNLAINLPLMIGDVVPPVDDKWECFLLLLDILQLCTARSSTTAHLGILEALIHSHHSSFASCYPDASFIPKLHYMVHFPEQIKRAGPLLYASCIRMEGKNLYFKNAARGSNFKNVPYTVATRHQRLLCSYLQCKNFFNTEIECGPTNETKQLCKEEFSVIKKVKESADLDYESLASVLVQRPTWLSYSGCKYTASYYVLVGWQDNDLPIFGKIKFIAVIEDKVLFCVHEYHTEGLDRHYHSFVLGRESKECVYWLSEIPSCRPFIGHRVSNYSYITFHSHVEK